MTQLQPGEQRWTVSRDLVNYRSTLEVIKDLSTLRFDDIDLVVAKRVVECYSWSGDDTSSVRGETQSTVSFTRGQWRVQTVTRTVLTSTPTDFQVHAQLDAYEDAQRVHSANWQRVIPRDHV